MEFNIWLEDKSKVFIGGNPGKGQHPLITLEGKNLQMLVDQEKKTVIIVDDTTNK